MSNPSQTPAAKWSMAPSWRTCLLIGAGLIALQGLILLAMGQPAFCTCGTIKLWHGNVLSAENSQHLTDWYTFTHIIHGFGFYLLLWLIAPRMAMGLRLALAVGLEGAWEVLENTPFIIDRYRQSALARGYVGDSVINSLGDTFAMAAGFLVARLVPVWTTVTLAVALELFVGLTIHDNLTLNIVQLVYPSEAISNWQAGK